MFRPALPFLAGVCLFASAMSAQALTVTGSSLPSPGGVIHVGDVVVPDVTFDFGAGFNLFSSDIRISYDPSRLDFRMAESTVSYDGYTLSFDDFLSAVSQYSPLPPVYSTGVDGTGQEYHAWSVISYPGLPMAGAMVLHGAFEVLAGGTSTVTIAGELAELVSPNLLTTPYSTDVQITAVPEPEVWVLWAMGLAVLGSRVMRQRKA